MTLKRASVLEDLSLNDNQFILNSTNLMAGVVGFNFNTSSGFMIFLYINLSDN